MENFLKAKAEGRLEEFLKSQIANLASTTNTNKDGKRKAELDIKEDEPGLKKQTLKNQEEHKGSDESDDDSDDE